MGDERVHDLDSKLCGAEPGVDVHSADEELACRVLEGDRRLAVPRLVRHLLGLPPGPRVGGGGDDARPVAAARRDERAPRLAKTLRELRHGPAHLRVGLDLGAKELVHHAVRSGAFARLAEDGRIGVGDHVSRRFVDDHELLFDSEADLHGCSSLSRVIGTDRRMRLV